MNGLPARRRVAHAERGFTLAASVFLVSVLAALAAVVINISSAQQATSLMSLQGARAFNAAQSGLAYATRAAVVSNSCTGANFTLTAAGLVGFTVATTCRSTTVTEGATSYQVYSLSATATAGAAATGDLTARTLVATATTAVGS